MVVSPIARRRISHIPLPNRRVDPSASRANRSGMELLACVYLAAGVEQRRLVIVPAGRGIAGNQLAEMQLEIGALNGCSGRSELSCARIACLLLRP